MYLKREYLADTHKHSRKLVMTICTPFGKHLPAFFGLPGVNEVWQRFGNEIEVRSLWADFN